MTTGSSTSGAAHRAASAEVVNEALIASFVRRDNAPLRAKDVGDAVLFDEVARLTRDVHDAIRTIAVTGGDDMLRSRARDSLEYVVSLTERAAHRTLDLVERGVPIVETIARDVRGASERARVLAGHAGQLQLALQLEQSALQAEQLQALLTDILMAQDFQDLTGQIVRRVANLLREVECKLFGLVKVAANLQAMNGGGVPLALPAVAVGSIDAEGPLIPGSDRRDVVHDQDEVDDLLSKLGF